MANVIIGTDLKHLIKIDRVGEYEMKDMDFTVEVTNGIKTLVFTKDQCVPENDGLDGYKVCYSTSDLGLGKIKIRVYVTLRDGDFKLGGRRREIIDLDPKINIVK